MYKYKILLLCFFSVILLSACSSSKSTSEKLLPDSGPTSAELIGAGSQDHAYYGLDSVKADYVGRPLVGIYDADSHYSHRHLSELDRDFHQVPNPRITAYIFPHLNNGEIPVPGYFTVFDLYERNHYALEQEGYHVSQ